MKRLALLIAIVAATVTPSGAWWQSVQQNSISSGACTDTYDSASCAIFAAFTTPPDTTRKGVINTAVLALKSCGTWTKMGFAYVTAAADSQAARINWITPGTATLTAINSPTFTADQGFNSDGSTSYLDVGAAPGTFSPLAQDDAHIAGWMTGTGNTTLPVGRQNSSGVYALNIGNATGLATTWRISATTLGIASDGTLTYWLISRTGATTTQAYKVGSAIGSVDTVPSTGVGSGNVHILESNTGFSASTAKVVLSHIGSSFNSTQALCTCQAWSAYMVSVGVIGAPAC